MANKSHFMEVITPVWYPVSICPVRVGSLGAMTKILADISQTLQRIEANTHKRIGDSR